MVYGVADDVLKAFGEAVLQEVERKGKGSKARPNADDLERLYSSWEPAWLMDVDHMGSEPHDSKVSGGWLSRSKVVTTYPSLLSKQTHDESQPLELTPPVKTPGSADAPPLTAEHLDAWLSFVAHTQPSWLKNLQ